MSNSLYILHCADTGGNIENKYSNRLPKNRRRKMKIIYTHETLPLYSNTNFLRSESYMSAASQKCTIQTPSFDLSYQLEAVSWIRGELNVQIVTNETILCTTCL